MRLLFKDFFKNIGRSFVGYNFFWHIVAITLTCLIVSYDIDWLYYIYTRNTLLDISFLPAVVLGGILPIIVPLYLIIRGLLQKSWTTTVTGWAVGQAVIIGSIISSFYKAFTGRVEPDLANTTINVSHSFNFGFWEHGIFWGWPSSHTAIAFAMSMVLIKLFPKDKQLAFWAWIYALYVGIGVSLSIHWFSEFIAGAIIGIVIGIVVGNSFKVLITKQHEKPNYPTI